jgi:hypothetical protein
MVTSLDNPNEKVEKLIMKVILLGEDNPTGIDYYPNKKRRHKIIHGCFFLGEKMVKNKRWYNFQRANIQNNIIPFNAYS